VKDQAELLKELERLQEDGRERISKAEHLLRRVTKAAENKGENSSKDTKSPLPLSLPPVSSNGRIQDLHDLLPIDSFLAKGIDPAPIKTILLGFLQPGSQAPFFNGGYTGMEQFRRYTRLPAKELKQGLRYLKSIGLVHQRRRKIYGRTLLSLNTKAETSPAREIAQLVLRARQSIKQEGVLIH